MNEPSYSVYVGVDWATEKHAVCVANGEGKVLGRFEVEHSGKGLEQLSLALEEYCQGVAEHAAVGIEVPRGPVVETLLERGFHVFALNPKQLDRFRDRHTMAGSKNDELDAFVLADALRTDLKLYRRVQIDDPTLIRLRELSRTADELNRELNRQANRLRELLLRYFVQVLGLCPAADERWLWALLEKAPRPVSARSLSKKQLEKLLREHRIRRFTSEQLKTALGEPELRVAPGVVDAAAEHVRTLLPILQVLDRQVREVEASIRVTLEQLTAAEPEPGQKREHRDAEILLSLPGVGETVAATMLAEASLALRERDYATLRATSGVAPVSLKSGKSAHVKRRLACNWRLLNVAYHWARTAIQNDERARAHYAALRKRGKTHGRAIRGVADRLMNILIGMLKSGTLYDPGRGLPPAAPEAA